MVKLFFCDILSHHECIVYNENTLSQNFMKYCFQRGPGGSNLLMLVQSFPPHDVLWFTFQNMLNIFSRTTLESPSPD